MKGLVNDIGKKKLIIILGVFIGLIILTVVLLLVVHAINNRVLTFSELEAKVLNAGKDYYAKNKDLLPQEDGGVAEVDDVTLSSGDFMKPMGDYTSKMEGVACTGKVKVNYVTGKYRYTALLDCGDNYKTETLVSYILKNEPKVFEGQGLYDLNNDSVFRGDNPKNYIKYADRLFRIVKITDNKALIIYNEDSESFNWDNRYNIDVNSNVGINDYTISRVKDKLAVLFKDKKFIKEQYKPLLSMYSLEIGRRKQVDDYNDGSLEKSALLEKQYIGLLPLYDYINGSIDKNCKSSEDISCSNYNYLNHYRDDWWLITAAYLNSFKAYYVNRNGEINPLECSFSNALRPVLMLSDTALYAGGTGTKDDPYLVK